MWLINKQFTAALCQCLREWNMNHCVPSVAVTLGNDTVFDSWNKPRRDTYTNFSPEFKKKKPTRLCWYCISVASFWQTGFEWLVTLESTFAHENVLWKISNSLPTDLSTEHKCLRSLLLHILHQLTVSQESTKKLFPYIKFRQMKEKPICCALLRCWATNTFHSITKPFDPLAVGIKGSGFYFQTICR